MARPTLKRSDLIHPELSYKLIGILFDVSNELGYGYQEKYYQKAVATALKEAGITYIEQAPAQINYRGEKIGIYFLDFLVENKIILEIKRGEHFSKTNLKQVYGYLKATGLQLGIVANFTSKGLQFRRIVHETKHS
ncbi:MAG: hypothetical protein UY78_C0011G0010 [Parcubacteria group bacterium GW2011_GWA1_53_13]|nr:MAG: hypothetical protein UY78_C0011G0010 [Parcubacteria group bacterium GW2011_GWA1_53_13]